MRPLANFPSSVWDGDTAASDRVAFENHVNPNAQDWDELATEVIAIQERLGACGAAVVGTANGTTVTAAETAGLINKTVLTLNVTINTTDNTTAGSHGSLKIYDFPQCGLLVLSAVADMTVTVSGNNAANSTVNIGVGTAAVTPDNEALTSTEQDICPVGSVVCSSNTGAYGGVLTTPVGYDGTASAKDAILNIAVDATGASGNGAVAVTGTLTLYWINGGDN